MKFVFMSFLIVGSSYADNNQTCMDKLRALESLKEKKLSGFEKVAYGVLNQEVLFGYSNDKDNDIDEQIRVLELELKNCK